jgi:hypothetical protein
LRKDAFSYLALSKLNLHNAPRVPTFGQTNGTS